MWEKTTKLIYNYEKEQEEFEFESLKTLFNEKINKPEERGSDNYVKENTCKRDDRVIEDNRQTLKTQDDDLKKFKKMAHLYSEKRIQEYESWKLWTIAIKESLGNKGRPLWREISKLHGSKSQGNKPAGNFYEEAN